MHNNKKPNWNIFNNFYNAFIVNKHPVFLTHFITKSCNARCPHCFVDNKSKVQELTIPEIEKISLSVGNSLRSVALTGGEPFLRDDLFDIASVWYRNTSVKSLIIPSNGSMPDKIESFIKKASKIDLPVSFFISYDFIGEKHSEYRGIDNLHNKVIETCNIIKQYRKFPITISLTLSPDNVLSSNETYRYIRDKIIPDNINCILIRGNKANILTKKQKDTILNQYSNIEEQINKDFDLNKISGYKSNFLDSLVINAKNKILWKYSKEIFKNNKYLMPCKAGSLIGILDSNGDIFPCEILSESFGNVKDYNYNFLKLWQSKKANSIRKKIINDRCRCTFECALLVNIFSNLKFYPEIIYNIIKNSLR